MEKVTSRRQVEIYECRTEDGSVGIQLGDGPVHMGHGEADLLRLLHEVFPERDPYEPQILDLDLMGLAEKYLDYWDAQERYKYLRDMYDHEHGTTSRNW